VNCSAACLECTERIFFYRFVAGESSPNEEINLEEMILDAFYRDEL
jgi:hypothetical protein